MKTQSTTLKVLTCAIFILTLSSFAQAQATRTWVSGVGDDVNPCSRTAPCKTWAGAISKTAAGGEIDALDPGGYGTLTITKSITVDGTNAQGFGSTLNSGGINGFVINDSLSGAANTIKVTLRNLSINGAGTTLGLNGIRFISGAQLSVEHCSIENQSGHGIDVSLNSTITARLNVTDTDIRRVNGSGVRLTNAGTGFIVATIDDLNVRISGNGVEALNNSRALVRNSDLSNNTGAGVLANGTTEVNLESCGASYNLDGVRATAGTIRISNVFITGNTTGLNLAGGIIKSWGNNKVVGNITDGAPTAPNLGQL